MSATTIVKQPKLPGGRGLLVDANLIITSETLPNAGASTPVYVKLPKQTGGKMALVIWNPTASTMTLGTGQDLTIDILINTATSGAGTSPIKQYSRTADYYFIRAGAGVSERVVIAKTGRGGALQFAAGQVVHMREISEHDLAVDAGGNTLDHIGVKFTTTVDLSALSLAAAIVPIA